MIDHPGLGKPQGNIHEGLGILVELRQKTAWMMHTMRSWNIKATMRSNSCRITYWRNK
jgi:hypothetical protein